MGFDIAEYQIYPNTLGCKGLGVILCGDGGRGWTPACTGVGVPRRVRWWWTRRSFPPAALLPASHGDGIATFSLMRESPLPALALTLWLEALVEHCGERLLRMKGLVDVAEMPGRPALIHGVRHVFAPPDWLDRWPSDNRRTRVGFIGEGVPRYFPARLLDAIEANVVDETRRQRQN